jgi:uncharacterized protein YndB with AHSA1/START domain
VRTAIVGTEHWIREFLAPYASVLRKGEKMNRIEQTYIINAPPEAVWQALTDPEVIEQWSGAPAAYDIVPGSAYSLWGGDIGGQIVEVDPLARLVQTWKPKDWTTEDSVVTFVVTPVEEGTRVDLIHENVEESDYDGTNQGWDTFYLGAIKRLIEAPAPAPIKRAAAKAPKKKTAAKKKSAAKKTTARLKATGKKASAKKKTAKRSKK